MSVKALEFYSGIGGLHRALALSSVRGHVVRAFDWDQAACRVYAANYGRDIVHKVDIGTLEAEELASLDAEVWLLSPSCQPYTVLNPLAKGDEDPRAKSFIRLIEVVLPRLFQMQKHPQRLLVENVAGFETSSTRGRLLATLHALGYSTIELLITPLQFGIPNSRLRYYLLAKYGLGDFPGTDGLELHVWRHIPGRGSDWIDTRVQSDGEAADVAVSAIHEYLDKDCPDDPHPHAIPDKIMERWGRLFDIVLPSSKRTCCFTRGVYLQ
ncbi:hypothetical protein BN946_scf185001.g44 [Trametes cinnabarina]|uniref:S-adenosyl-L-methionine-dependent methyltransferase n=1 Tax=Pycnoporus cinnabarinus TaxID=5643 RepID=A0A060SKX5_PYCCI|nr:hypothetical protein BN946_scf185001.g44 [Trametes cinnabarina]